MQLPKRSHIFPPAFMVIFQGVGWLLEQSASRSEMWQSFQFGWLTALALAFWLGLFVQDLFNSRSWIHENWRLLNRIFEIDAIHSTHIVEDPERVAIRALLRFTRTISNGSIVVSAHPLYINSHPFVIVDEELDDCP